MPLNVPCELLHRIVAALRFLLQCHQNYVVKVTTQSTTQFFRLAFAERADCLGGFGDRRPIWQGFSFHTVHRSARLLRLLLANSSFNFSRAVLFQLVGRSEEHTSEL